MSPHPYEYPGPAVKRARADHYIPSPEEWEILKELMRPFDDGADGWKPNHDDLYRKSSKAPASRAEPFPHRTAEMEFGYEPPWPNEARVTPEPEYDDEAIMYDSSLDHLVKLAFKVWEYQSRKAVEYERHR